MWVVTLVALPLLTVDELRILLRAIQERVAHADADEREVLRSLGTAVDEAILNAPRPPRPRAPSLRRTVEIPQREVRRWARERGIPVVAHGQVPLELVNRYYAERDDEQDDE